MIPTDKPQFLAVLSRTFRMQRQSVPDTELLDVWWAKLEPFPLAAVAQAFSRHLDVSEFAPTPAAILKHLPQQSDGRPDADEAWAIGLRSVDEADTVVWTQECAEAFNAARPVLDAGDEVGARMAFKAAYARVVERNRAAGQPARWFASLGFDASRREQVVTQAVREGRLALADARAAVPLLGAPEGSDGSTQAEQQLAKLRDLTASIGTAMERRDAEQQRRNASALDDLNAAKRAMAERVAEYERSHA